MTWVYWLIGSLFYVYQFFFRTIFSTIGEDVAQSFHISVADLSIFFAYYGLSYALVQIPGGMLLDLFGPRKVLTLAMTALAGGVLLVCSTSSYELAIVGRILMGIGSAFGFLGASKLVIMWFPRNLTPFLLGSTVFLGGLGGAFSNYVYEALPDRWSWNETLLFTGLLGLGFAVVIGVLLKERKPKNSGTPKTKVSLFSQIRMVLANRNTLLAATFAFFSYIPISIIADSWGPMGFEKIFNTSTANANLTVPYFYISYSVGNFIFSAIASYFRSLRKVLLIECCFSVVVLYLLMFQTQIGTNTYFGIPGFLLLSSASGFFLSGVTFAFPLGTSNIPQEISGTAVGFINCLCMISGGIYNKMMEGFLKFFWDGSLNSQGLPIFSGATFRSAFQPLLVTAIMSLLVVYFITEKAEV